MPEALYAEPMTVVVAPGHPLAAKQKPTWVDLAALPCVMPPPWASLRVKLNQMVYREGLYPPVDIVGSASFLAQLSFLHQGGAAAFMSRTVALHFQRQGLPKVLALKGAFNRTDALRLFSISNVKINAVISSLRYSEAIIDVFLLLK